MSVQTVNTNTDLDASKLHLIKVGDKKYDVRYDEDKKYLALEIAPKSERLADSFLLFWYQTKRINIIPTVRNCVRRFSSFQYYNIITSVTRKNISNDWY